MEQTAQQKEAQKTLKISAKQAKEIKISRQIADKIKRQWEELAKRQRSAGAKVRSSRRITSITFTKDHHGKVAVQVNMRNGHSIMDNGQEKALETFKAQSRRSYARAKVAELLKKIREYGFAAVEGEIPPELREAVLKGMAKANISTSYKGAKAEAAAAKQFSNNAAKAADSAFKGAAGLKLAASPRIPHFPGEKPKLPSIPLDLTIGRSINDINKDAREHRKNGTESKEDKIKQQYINAAMRMYGTDTVDENVLKAAEELMSRKASLSEIWKIVNDKSKTTEQKRIEIGKTPSGNEKKAKEKPSKEQCRRQSQKSKTDRKERLDPNNKESKERLKAIQDVFRKNEAGNPLTAAETALYNFVREKYKKIPDFKIEDISFGKHEKILNEVLRNNGAFNKLKAERKADRKGQALSVDKKLNLARSVLEKELSGKPLTAKEQKLAQFIHEQFRNDPSLKPEHIDKRFLEQSKSLQQIVAANRPFELKETNDGRNRSRSAAVSSHTKISITPDMKLEMVASVLAKKPETLSAQEQKLLKLVRHNTQNNPNLKMEDLKNDAVALKKIFQAEKIFKQLHNGTETLKEKTVETPVAGKDNPAPKTVAAEVGRVSNKMEQIYARHEQQPSAPKKGKAKTLQEKVTSHARQNPPKKPQPQEKMDPMTLAQIKRRKDFAR
ncbi:MAG: hypothetical protein IJ752_05855 [Alphaproteobacteria bacterium]|nr:hypothetical protein [Alphaproteobacteria bacterium]